MRHAKRRKADHHTEREAIANRLGLEYEALAWASGAGVVAGIDEVGRGCLAGPVVAAAVILPRPFDDPGVADSKTVAEQRRERLCDRLITTPGLVWGLGVCSVAEIDRMNILEASREAMRRAVRALNTVPDHLLVDGLPVPGFEIGQTGIVRGDAKSPSIAAASLIAKAMRDRMMRELDALDRRYGFAQHKGYATAQHLAMIAKHGITEHHRRSFAPVSQLALPL